MESVEVSAKTVEEATRQALDKLGKRQDEVEITVLSEGHKGILGFVRGDNARVRVTVRSIEGAEIPEVARRRESAPRRRSSPREEASSPRVADSSPMSTQSPAKDPAPKPTTRPNDVAIVAQDTLEELLERMGIFADVTYRGGDGGDDSPILFDIAGEDLGVLIGRRGETLASLQFLLNLLIGRRLGSWVRVAVDVEGYRARREEYLRSLAQRTAERVRRTGQAVPLEPMPPNERRIVHMALQESADVTTESSGYGEERRVFVIPRPR
jgi:spoIIIJ-associated protein